MKKLQTLPCSLRITPNSVFPPRAYCSTLLRQPATFLEFPAQNFLPQFTLLTVTGSSGPPRSRLSELLTVCCGCFRKKSVALEFRLRFKLFPVRLVNVLESGNPLFEKVKFNPSVQLVIWNNEQGISYHKLYQKKWMGVPKILGPYKPALAHLYQFTKPENCLNFEQLHHIMWNCQNSHPFVCFTKCLGVD